MGKVDNSVTTPTLIAISPAMWGYRFASALGDQPILNSAADRSEIHDMARGW